MASFTDLSSRAAYLDRDSLDSSPQSYSIDPIENFTIAFQEIQDRVTANPESSADLVENGILDSSSLRVLQRHGDVEGVLIHLLDTYPQDTETFNTVFSEAANLLVYSNQVGIDLENTVMNISSEIMNDFINSPLENPDTTLGGAISFIKSRNFDTDFKTQIIEEYGDFLNVEADDSLYFITSSLKNTRKMIIDITSSSVLDPQNIDRTEKMNAQAYLAHFGYYNDEIDGVWGPNSRSAVLHYRRDNSPSDIVENAESIIHQILNGESVNSNQIMTTQQYLADFGYYRGDIDGIWGDNSAWGARRYRDDYNLQAE